MMLKDFFLMIISELILVIFVLVGVAFLTLLERKVLGYIQLRKGPNKLGVMGLLQPFSDAIKLFSKESVYPLKSNFNLFYLSPIMNLFLSLMLWLTMPLLSSYMNFRMELLMILCFMSLSAYTIMISGWSSNSNYAMLGSIRVLAQSISYEVGLFLILMVFISLVKSFKFSNYYIFQEKMWFLGLCLPVCMMWLVIGLAETNRTPFDLAEGESELVSGFNVEYSGGSFALIFLAEYSSILFMSMLSVMMFLGGNYFSFMFYLKLVLISFFWIWVRGTLPRFRYDNLMQMIWKIYLPMILGFLIYYYSLSVILVYFL